MEPFVQFCDDIRQEANGKWILIGCYGESMVVPQFPFSGRLSCLVTMEAEAAPHRIEVEFRLASGGRIGTLEMELEAIPGPYTRFQLPIPPASLTFSSPDTIMLYLGVNGEPVRELGRLKIEQGQVPGSPPH